MNEDGSVDIRAVVEIPQGKLTSTQLTANLKGHSYSKNLSTKHIGGCDLGLKYEPLTCQNIFPQKVRIFEKFIFSR
jgi:hypothetical protein